LRGDRPSPRPWTIALAAAACLSAAGPGLAEGGEEASDLEEAFRAGAGEAGADLSLSAEREGAALALSASDPGEGGGADLVCVGCSPEDALAAARALGARAAAARGGPRPGLVDLEGASEGDSVEVDGVGAPALSGPLEIEPGDHTVEVLRSGESMTFDVRVPPGGLAELDIGEPTELDPSRARLPVLLAGLGLAVAAAGGALLGFDGGCASTTVDADGDCSEVHDLLAAGWALVSAGAAAAVAGVAIGIARAPSRGAGSEEPEGGAR